jgi:uncharacterized protein YcfJ
MKVLTASILALGLAASIGTASAQSSGYYSQYGQPQYGQSQYGQQQYGQYGQYGQPVYGQPTADRYGQSSGAYYDYARVLRVDPVYAQGYGNSGYSYPANAQQGCVIRQDSYAGNGYNNGYNTGYGNNGYSNSGYVNDGYNNNGYANQGSTAGRTVATVIGGVLGAALGSQVGGGSARYATSAIGTMVGGVVGQKVYESAQRNRYPRTGVVQVCDPVQVDNGGYQGSYTQAGYGQSAQYGYGNNARINAYDVTYEYGGRTYTTRTNYNPGSRMRVRVAVNPS